MEPPPTLEGLVKEVRISPDLLEQRCSDEHLKSISLFLDWQSVAPHLGLSEREIEDIESEYRKESERRLKVLRKWKKKYSYMATFKSLVVVLLKVGNADDAEQVCRLLQTPEAGEHSTSWGASFPIEEQQSSLATVAGPTKQLPDPVVEVSESPVQPLECNIEKEIEELEKEFLNVVDKAADDLENVPLSKIKRCVTQLRVSVKYQHKKFLENHLSAIENAQSVGAVFAILGLYWDFLNCGLLTELVHRLGNDETKLLMEQYTEKLRRFRMKTKLGDFMEKWAQSTPPHFIEFKTEMGDDWRDRTLEDLEEFRNKLARSMYVKEYALRIKSTMPGSVFITWTLPSSLPGIADTLQSAFEVLQKHGVLRMIFQEKCIADLTSPKSQTSTEHQVLGECKHTDEESPPMSTSTAPMLLPTLPEMSQQGTEQQFDMITALLDAGVPHIVERILQSLDVKSLGMSEQVSRIWRDSIIHIWKHIIKHNVDSNPLWRAFFKRRGWHTYLDMSPAEQISRQFYRELHHSASMDIHSLEENWRSGDYTLTTIQTGSRTLCLQCDDKKIVTGHGNSTIKIWDRSTLQLVKVLKGHKSAVHCLQCNEEVVISGSADHTVLVWDILTGQVINDRIHHKAIVRSLKFTTDTLVTASEDGTVGVWNIKSPAVVNMKSPTDVTLRKTLVGHEDYVFAVDLSEATIISGSKDKTIKVWDNSTGELVRTLHGHSNSVHCLQLHGSHLISGSGDKTLRIWHIDTGECIRVLGGHSMYVDIFCVAVDNKRILSGSGSTIKVWDLAAALDSGSSSDTLCITTLQEHASSVSAIQFDDFDVVSVSDDGTLIVCDFLDPTPPS